MAKKATTKKRSAASEDRVKVYAGLFFMIDLLDSFEMEKIDDNAIRLKIKIGEHENLIVVHHITELMQPLGEWISKLPPRVFQDRISRVNQFNKDMGV